MPQFERERTFREQEIPFALPSAGPLAGRVGLRCLAKWSFRFLEVSLIQFLRRQAVVPRNPMLTHIAATKQKRLAIQPSRKFVKATVWGSTGVSQISSLVLRHFANTSVSFWCTFPADVTVCDRGIAGGATFVPGFRQTGPCSWPSFTSSLKLLNSHAKKEVAAWWSVVMNHKRGMTSCEPENDVMGALV